MSTLILTCPDRASALRTLQVASGDKSLTDTPESCGPLLDLVDKDIVRVEDHNFHWPAKVIPGKKWDDKYRAEVLEACKQIKGTPK